jgi:hypothetical protein
MSLQTRASVGNGDLPLFLASFNGTDGVGLQAHRPNIGPVATIGAGTWSLLSNRAVATNTADLRNIAVWDVGDATVSIETQMPLPASQREGGLIARYLDVDNYFYMACQGTGLLLYEMTAGVLTARFTGSVSAFTSFLVTSTANMRLEVSATALKGFVDGVEWFNYASTVGAARTKHGLANYRSATFGQIPFEYLSMTAD